MADPKQALEDLALLVRLSDRMADEGGGSMHHADTLAQRNAVVRRLREFISGPGFSPLGPVTTWRTGQGGALVRVCEASDAECSRGCNVGACLNRTPGVKAAPAPKLTFEQKEAMHAVVSNAGRYTSGLLQAMWDAAHASGVKAAPEPLNGIPATDFHGEGAIARCSYCGRYSLDRKTLGEDRYQPVCECGEKHGWSGSFKKPGPDAKWSGKAPAGVPADIQAPLTEEQIRSVVRAAGLMFTAPDVQVARAVERAHGIGVNAPDAVAEKLARAMKDGTAQKWAESLAGVAEVAPTEQQAHDLGAKGAPPTERERLLFEAWMRGHCWALSATWDGRQYRSDAEQGGDLDPRAMATRRLFAAWRDRAALGVSGTHDQTFPASHADGRGDPA